uniref:AMP-dependent synthetase/ligase domain-containing protein n=1 Tax=Paramoeba aestuarina TaxID=180227 RepID=A0A7S4P6P4_9EUKA|mmetsp:Transcript_37101/g.58396  ORF Transcript_37101/g.58396 Transcript_37101/m.58396 type:complete len:225 (-) Transcript_37101:3-677(-)
MSDQPVRRHPRQPRQGAISSVISWTNNTFNPTHSTANAARLAAVLGAYYLYKKKNEWEEEIEASSFLSEVPEQRSTVAYPPEAKQGIYRHFRAPLYPDPLPTIPFPGIDTLYSNFQRSVRLFPKRNCLGTMVEKTKDGKKVLEYEWVNYREVAERATRFGSGLVGRLGLKTGSFVGMMMLNRTEWVVCEQGCNAYNLVTVPLYDTLGAGVVEYITNEVGMEDWD